MAGELSDLYFLFKLFDIPFTLNNVIIYFVTTGSIMIIIMILWFRYLARKYHL